MSYYDEGLAFDRAGEIAHRIYEESIDNGENIAYQIHLWNAGVIS